MAGICRVVFNQKGGVGKSTITVNLAAVAAKRGKRVLVVDLDPQGNTTQYLLGTNEVMPTIKDYFLQLLSVSMFQKLPEQFLLKTPFDGLMILAAHRDLADLMIKLESRYKMFKLRETLRGLLSFFDEIWIDTPPALNFYTRSALIAADRCVIPFDCDAFSRQAIYDLLHNLEEIQQDHNQGLSVEGIVVNQFQARATLPSQLVEELKKQGFPVLASYLSSSVKIKESHHTACPMVFLEPRHKLSQQFEALYNELSHARAICAV